MSPTTNFHLWLRENVITDNFEDYYCLYEAVSSRETVGDFEVSIKDEMTFIKGATSTLCLATENARLAFLREVENLKDDKDMDWDSWIGYKRNMSNPNA